MGKSVNISCSLSNGTLLEKLSWYRNNKTIVDGVAYRTDHGKNEFVLTIQKLSLEDAGDYVCSGFDMIMGNNFNSIVFLDIADSGKPCKYLFKA